MGAVSGQLRDRADREIARSDERGDAGAYIRTFGKGEWDIGFGARTPLLADKAEFVVDVVLTDYVYVAADEREFADAAQVDRPGVKIAVGENSTSDQFLSRTLKSARLVRRLPAAVLPTRFVTAKRMCMQQVQATFNRPSRAFPEQSLFQERSIATATWLPCRKENPPLRKAESSKSSERRKEPAWCARSSNS